MSRFLTLAPLQIAQALVGFGAIAAFTRLMSPDEFGAYALALSVSMAAHTVLFTWAEAAAFRFFATAQAGRRLSDHFATLIGIAFVLGAATLLIVGLIVSRLGFDDEAGAIAAFAAAAATLRFFTRIARESDRAALSFTRYAAMETAYLTLGFAAGIALLVVFDLGPAAPFAGLTLGGLLIAAIDAPGLWRKARGGYATFSRAQHYAAYGAPLALALVVDLGVQAVARIVLSAQGGAAEVGAYAAAFGLARPLDLMFMGLSTAFAPLIFSAYEEKGASEARHIAGQAFTTLAAITLPACVGIILVAQPLTALMVGPELAAQAALALPALTVAGLFSGFTLYYWSEAFQLTHRTGQRALLMLIPGAIQLSLTFLLARTHGAAGAALAAAAGAIAGFVALAIAGRFLIALPLPFGGLARTLAACCSMTMGLALLGPATDAPSLALFVAAGGAFYVLSAIAFNVAGVRPRVSAVLQSLAAKVRTLQPTPTTDTQ
ncbi:MAG: oligosaccharide flippase family protein [Hyphomonadaceae bacterium]